MSECLSGVGIIDTSTGASTTDPEDPVGAGAAQEPAGIAAKLAKGDRQEYRCGPLVSRCVCLLRWSRPPCPR
jgi:hypothetical protein